MRTKEVKKVLSRRIRSSSSTQAREFIVILGLAIAWSGCGPEVVPHSGTVVPPADGGFAAAPTALPTRAVTAVVPSSAVAGSGDLTLTIAGADLAPGSWHVRGAAVWSVPGQRTRRLDTHVVSATELTAVIPAALLATPGSATIFVEYYDVMDDGGRTLGQTNRLVFTVSAVPPPPTGFTSTSSIGVPGTSHTAAPLGMGRAASASAPRFTTFSVPGGTDTRGFGINNRGQIVGRYVDANGVPQGFLREGDGTFRTISAPGGASGTWAQAINDWGDVVGVYFDADSAKHGFLLRGESFTVIDFPGALETNARGIDDLGRITGNYIACMPEVCNETHPDPLEIGFVLDRGGFHTVFFPGSDSTDVWDEALRTRVGDWSDLEGNVFGYVQRGEVFTVVNVPDSVVTSIRGINLQGTLVGVFVDTDGNLHGFARVPRGFIPIDVPGASGTFVNRINELGQITGAFLNDQGEAQGFIVADWKQGVCRNGPPGGPHREARMQCRH